MMSINTLRKDFCLPEEDIEYLNSRGFRWETISEGYWRWVLIHDFPICEGYQVTSATAALQIPDSYPMSQIDMVYFYPPLVRKDGKPIPATEALQDIQQLRYQRWSRHRTPQNPWRCGLDNISTHVTLIEEWLPREFRAS
jgi:hypothetical protein